MDLDKVIQLFCCEDSGALHDRHIAAIDKLCKANTTGFAVRDLSRVAQILRLTLQLVRQGALHFVAPLCQLVRTLRQPYVKLSSTDELKLLGVMTDLLTVLAGALDVGMPPQLQICTAEFLAEFASAYNNRPALLELSQASASPADLQTAHRLYSMHQSFLHKSNMAAAVCQALAAALASPCTSSSQMQEAAANSSCQAEPHDLLDVLVVALLNFSYSPDLCEQLLQAQLLELLLQLLLHQQRTDADAGATSKLTTQVVELLWNLLELAPAAAAEQLSPSHHHRQQQSEWQSAAASAGSSCRDSISISLTSSRRSSRPPSCVSDAPSAGWTVPGAATGSSLDGADEPTTPGAAALRVPPATCPTAQAHHAGSRIATELVDALADLFKQQLADTSSKQAKEQRNDTLAVLQHLSSIPTCCRALYSSSFLPAALAAAVVPELQASSCLVPAGAAARDTFNFEMKLLLWSILGNAAAAVAACREAAVEAGLLAVLLMVVRDSDAAAAPSDWNSEQLEVLRRLAWSVLMQVAPLCKEGFAAAAGVLSLVRHIESCYSADTGGCSRTAGTASIQGGRAAPSAILPASRNPAGSIEPATRLLQKLVAGDAVMAAAFAEQGLAAALLQLLQSPACDDLEAARQGVLLVLAELCTAGGSCCQQLLRQADGVAVLLRECERVLQTGASVPSLSGLAALDCLWRCAVPSARMRAQLLALDGLDVLLQLLQQGSKYLRPVVLSVLADLLADPQAHAMFLDWHAPAQPGSSSLVAATATASLGASLTLPGGHSNPSTTGPQLLIDIWREQDAERGISGPDGLLASLTRPLAGVGGRSSWPVAEQGPAGGYCRLLPERQRLLQRIAAASTPDTLMDKVHACFAQLRLDAVLAGLPPADAAVLVVIQQYQKFRQGEVWQDIKQQLDAAGMQPTPEDGIRVLSGIQHSELIASRVVQQQAALLGAAEAERLSAEQTQYAAMAAQAVAEARSKVYAKDTSKLTMRERLAAKAHKEEMLKHSITASTAAAVAGAARASVAEHDDNASAAHAGDCAGSGGADAMLGSACASVAGKAAGQPPGLVQQASFGASRAPGSLVGWEPRQP